MSGQTAFTGFLSASDKDNFGNVLNGALNRSSGGSPGLFENGTWDAPSRLSFSIVPDETEISDYWKSSLYRSFRQIFDSRDELEQTIGNAFQAWARESSINFGQVADNGDYLGIAGLAQGDSRFGDIRIGAIPLQENVLAVTLPFHAGMSGTWAGDILFNSNAKFNSSDEFYAVALHEIGHALGLEHSDVTSDVMFAGGFNTVLSGNDKDSLLGRYGTRALDQYDDPNNSNNTQDDATRIELAGSLKGEIPLIAFGDIDSSNDEDFYDVDIYSEYSGNVTFRLVTSGISLLAPEISVLDSNGNPLLDSKGNPATATSSLPTGDDLQITVPTAAQDQLFLRIQSAGVLNRDVGSYTLVTLFDADVQYDPQVLETTIRQDLWSLDQSDVHTIFSEPTPLFNDDLHTNDTLATATDLDPLAGLATEDRFRVQAVIADSVDVDFYRFLAPDVGSTTLTATLTAMEQFGLAGKLEFFDINMARVAANVINNGNGRLMMQVAGIQPGDDYYVKVAADRPGESFDTGNYNLDLGFAAQSATLTTFAEGQLSLVQSQAIHTLFVAETQLFNLGIDAGFNRVYDEQAIWMTVYSDDGKIVHRALTRPGEYRTANSVVLQPGTYSIRTNLALAAGSSIPPNQRRALLHYRVRGTNIGDPIGPELIKSGRQPFPKCDPTTNEYCYPGDRHTEATFLVVDGNESSIPVSGTKSPDHQDANDWYWYQNWNG